MTIPRMTDTQRKVLGALQGDLPDDPEPYDILAQRLGMPVGEFLKVARGLVQAGCLRKVSALVNHLQAGFQANAMCVWKLAPERMDGAGETIAAFDEVTHCYQRPATDEWPYALFCMVHAGSRKACEDIARKIARVVNPIEYRVIYSTRELKKDSLRLRL
jgi:DNA-binding Lrp family transcriptional regulator